MIQLQTSQLVTSSATKYAVGGGNYVVINKL